jgi:ribosome maturation factor RimP
MGFFCLRKVGLMPIFCKSELNIMLSTKEIELQALIQPTIEGLGFQYVGCEMIAQGRHSLLRIYADKAQDGGITIDECAAIGRQLSAVLDVEDPIKGQYQLEVSSPGLDCPLFTLEQFQQAVGSKVKVRLAAPLDGQRNFVGYLKAVKDEMILVHSDEKEVQIPYGSIFKANVVYEFK